MPDKKKSVTNQPSKKGTNKHLNESQRTFSKGREKNQEKFYIAKPKITSQGTGSDNDKKK